MSLAATGGGLGGGGGAGPGAMAMAHQAHHVGQGGIPPPPQADAHADTGHGPPPPSAAVLGADLLDKQQAITLRQVKGVAHLPLVAVDLFASEPCVALFPKKPQDPATPVHPILVGKMKARVALKVSEASHKTFRKYLNHSKPFASVKAECLAKATGGAASAEVAILDRPHRWLGLRRIEDAPAFVAETAAVSASAAAAGTVAVVNSSLDGSDPQNDDNDRVLYRVTLNPAKKPLTVLPEEAVQLLLHQAQDHVHHKLQASQDPDAAEHTDDDVEQYPCAIAIPAWAAHDAAVEAVFDATGQGGIFVPRSVCALAGTLMLGADGRPNPVLERLQKVRAAMAKEFQRSHSDPDDLGAAFEDDVLLILLGATADGIEATAIQVSTVQQTLTTCLFGNYKVLSNVSYQCVDPLAKLEACCTELEAAVEAAAPEADGPAGIVVYGTPPELEKIQKRWNDHKKVQPDWAKVPVFTSKSDAVAMGTAVLGAVAHGRQLVLVPKERGSQKMRAELGLRVQNVAPAAVGVRLNYHGDDDSKWTAVKTVFDFDRRIPAGPYPLELIAAECVVHRAGKELSDEEFIKAVKETEGAKHIPQREEAALALRVQVMQRWTRDGEWKKVGDTMEPLVKLDEDNEEAKIACESVVLEITLGVHGMLTTNLEGERYGGIFERSFPVKYLYPFSSLFFFRPSIFLWFCMVRESVVQAVKSARQSAFRFYVGIALAVLFFGGFLFKSYWEEYVLNRDTEKLLAYYRHVLPGSISDGDHRSAMHIVYRYRHNKAALWTKIETKYGVLMREAHEWDDYQEGEGKTEGDGDAVDLDDEDGRNEEGAPDGSPKGERPVTEDEL